jgi:hypothetical protein
VLLRPTDDARTADVDDNDGCHYERVGVLDRPEPECVPEAGADLPAYRRELARRRCTMLVRGTAGVAITTGIIGIWPGLHLAWVFTALSGVAALGLVGLIAYGKEVETELRRRRDRRERWAASHEQPPSLDPAAAGYPGAWDDSSEVRAAAR